MCITTNEHRTGQPARKDHRQAGSLRQLAEWVAITRTAALSACLLMTIPGGIAAPAPAPATAPSLPPLAPFDGLTRESFAELDAPPEPAPFAAAPVASAQQQGAERRRARVAARRHRRALRQTAQTQPPVIVVKSPPRRNPATRFVYWWNGFVIRNFHTKFGTVLLGTVGAEA